MQSKLFAATTILATAISAQAMAEDTIDYTGAAQQDANTLPSMTADMPAAPTSAEPSLAELSAKLNNPVSDIWMLFTQNDTMFMEDKAGKDYTINSFKFQPVMSFPVGEDYNFILRPVFQHLSMEAPGMDRENGMGDTALLAVMGPSELQNNWTWGVGMTALFPTASEKWMTTGGKDQAAIGPALSAFYLGEKWVYGGVLQPLGRYRFC